LKKQPFLKEEHFPYIVWVGAPKSIKQIHVFIKHNQAMSRQDFKATHDEIRDFLSNQGVNFGILLMADGTYVFTEKKVKMDAVLVKLTTGINYNGVVKNTKTDLDLLDQHLAGRTE
jgi:hypothetical protein